MLAGLTAQKASAPHIDLPQTLSDALSAQRNIADHMKVRDASSLGYLARKKLARAFTRW